MSGVGGAAPIAHDLRMPLLPDGGATGTDDLAGSTPGSPHPPSLWSRLRFRVSRPADAPVSDYEVLIHGGTQRFGTNTIRLSDPRLRPRFPVWLILALVLLFAAGIMSVFFLVPRGMGFGSAQFNVTTIYLNKTVSSYKLLVRIKLPIYNNNYVDGFLSGNVTMRFYKVIAGQSVIEKTRIQKRVKHQEITSVVDASFVPLEYITTVLNNCFEFPHELVFFLDGQFEGHYLGQKQTLTLDTYTFVECPDLGPEDALAENKTSQP